MKVIQILPELNAGGVECCVMEVADYLARAGHQSIVISNGGRMVNELQSTGSRHIQLPVHRKSLASLMQVRALRKLLTREHPDILHAHSRVPAWLAWLAWRGMDPATRPRWVTTVHGFYSTNPYSAIMTRGERVIAVSASVRQYINENYPAARPSSIRTILHGIDPQSYQVGFEPSDAWLDAWSTAHPGLAGKHVLLLPGRLTRLKGHDDFLWLIAALKHAGIPVHGLIAGDTHPKKRAYLADLHARAATLDIADQVTFLGHRSDIREIMAVSDLVCALSQQPESFGRTVLEAIALGKPVAGYACGGVGELLDTLFPAGRVPLAHRDQLLATTRTILQTRPRPLPVTAPFTLNAMCHSTVGVYQELLDWSPQ